MLKSTDAAKLWSCKLYFCVRCLKVGLAFCHRWARLWNVWKLLVSAKQGAGWCLLGASTDLSATQGGFGDYSWTFHRCFRHQLSCGSEDRANNSWAVQWNIRDDRVLVQLAFGDWHRDTTTFTFAVHLENISWFIQINQEWHSVLHDTSLWSEMTQLRRNWFFSSILFFAHWTGWTTHCTVYTLYTAHCMLCSVWNNPAWIFSQHCFQTAAALQCQDQFWTRASVNIVTIPPASLRKSFLRRHSPFFTLWISKTWGIGLFRSS